VGKLEGVGVGSRVDESVGDADSAAVGDEVGKSVEDGVGDTDSAGVGDEVSKSVEDGVGAEVLFGGDVDVQT